MKKSKIRNIFKTDSLAPRVIIFVLDLISVTIGYMFSIALVFNFNFIKIDQVIFFKTLFLVNIIFGFVFYYLKIYSGIVRYTGIRDIFRISSAIAIAAVTILLLNFIFIRSFSSEYINPNVLGLIASFSFVLMVSYKLLVKFIFIFMRNLGVVRKYVIIYGANEIGIITKEVLDHDLTSNIKVVAFIDDDKQKQGKVMNGVPIISFNLLKNFIKDDRVDEVVIADITITAEQKNRLVDLCLINEIPVLNVPNYKSFDDRSFSHKQLTNINIEELLQRDIISINNTQVKEDVVGKRILITGAAGSIGSEIVRQLIGHRPSLIILCDQAETPLHQLHLEIEESKCSVNTLLFLASVTNETRMRDLFVQFSPQIIYHAAAYKHVPMMELFPTESIRNNVIGTRILADLAVEFGVSKFVMVSTDKAVNPTNVMGASKRIAELYVQALSKLSSHKTQFITTRFGNVLGSNGSVINRFKQQIISGGPLTVTHPNITRFFMTIPEACQLVLEAATMGKGGEIFVFDMGESVQISDVAKKMIRLYGLIPNIDIEIVYTGLRPGEKLYEELLNTEENTSKTYHKKILIAKIRNVDFEIIKSNIDELEELVITSQSEYLLVQKMTEIVPEFQSNNQIFKSSNQPSKILPLFSGNQK